MTKLKFDSRHSLTFFDANGSQNPFPFNEGDVITTSLYMDKFEAFDEILNDVSPNAIWASHLYPQGHNENYDEKSGTIFFEATSINTPEIIRGLRWRVDHEDTLLAIATKENENDVLSNVPHQIEIKIKMNLLVKEVYRIDYLPESTDVEWYAKLIASGEKEEDLVFSEVILQ